VLEPSVLLFPIRGGIQMSLIEQMSSTYWYIAGVATGIGVTVIVISLVIILVGFDNLYIWLKKRKS
jgi:hypothetical protein